MLALILATSLTLAAAPPQETDEAKIEATLEDLRVALKSKQPEVRAQGITTAARVVDVKVVVAVSKGLKDRDRTVITATIEALRFTAHPKALQALNDTLKRNKNLAKDVELSVQLIRAVGQHGDVSSVPILQDKLFSAPDYTVVRARIAALGNIRDRQAVEALLALMKSASRRNVQPYMESLRVSLMVLTGTDQGKSQDLWIKWWNENKRTFEVLPQEPALPEAMQRRWNQFWGRERTYDRKKKRGERGQDPEK
jgi:hypothetical protein